MSLRLTRRGALALGALALVVPVAVVSTSAAILTDTDASLNANSIGTSACSTSTWDTLVSGLSNVTSYMPLGGAATTPSSSTPTSSQTGAWTPSSVTTGVDGALYCGTDTAVTFDADGDKIAAPNTVTFSDWRLTSGSDTMALWFKGTSAVAGGLATVSKTGAGGWTDRGLWIETGGYVAFGGGGTSTTSTGWSIRSTGTYNDGRWHMVAVVMGNTGTNLGATLYVDGVQQATNTTGSYYATANGTGTTRFQIGDVEKPLGITGIPGVSYLGTIDEFLLVNAALTASQLSSAMPIGVTAASFAPTQNALTSATVGTRKPFDSISTTANATDIISASIAPQASITSAKVTPSVSVTGATVTPTAVSVTAATVTTAPKNISSSTVQTTGTASKVTVSGSTGLRITAAVPGGVTYGTSVGWRVGDYVYVGAVAGCSVGATVNKCATGYDTSLNGSWYPITSNNTGDITVTVGAAVAAYFVNCTGGTGCVVSAGTSKSMLITTSSSHSFAASDAVTFSGASSTITNGSYTVITVPSTTTLTINPAGLGAPTALTATGTATKAVTSAVLTATNTFTTSDTVTVSGLTGVGSANINIADAPITARTSTTLTITISPYAGATISLTSQTGTATRPITTASFTANNTFINGSAVTVTGLTGSNADVVNVTGATIASVTSTGFTVTIPATTSTVSLTSQAGTATSAVKQVTITATNAFADGNTVTISATGDATLDGTSGTIANRTATGFTYTLTNAYSGTNIDATTGIAAVAQTTVTVTANNAFVVGNLVTLSGTTGLDGGPYAITSATSTGFTYTVSSYAGPNLITTAGNAMVPLTVVTITDTAHGYVTNDRITITTTGTGAATLNGTFTITKVDANSFRYTISAYSGANLALTGTASTFIPNIKVVGSGFTFVGAEALTITGTGDSRLDTHVCTINAAPTPTATTVYCTLDASITEVPASPALSGTLIANGTSVTVVTSNSLTTSDTVTVAGAGAPFDGVFPVASASGSQFTFTVPSSAYVTSSAGTWAKNITLATITTDAAHGLVATNSVTISGSGSPFDGTFTVVSAPSTTTFTINLTAASGTPTSSDTGLLASKAGLYWAAQLGA